MTNPLPDKPLVPVCSSGETCRLNDELERLQQQVQQLSELVSLDPLTHLFNYRHFSHVLAQEMERSQRTQQATTLIMIDIDHFKQVNDTWGHEIGNQALKMVAKCLLSSVRKLDITCRYGGEEFAIILPSTEIMTGAKVAERIRENIANTPLTIYQNQANEADISLTVSLGLSMYTGSRQETAATIIASADGQLYQAKQQGRNQVSVCVPDTKEQQVNYDEKAALFDMFKPSEE